jgi:hypothetical protein
MELQARPSLVTIGDGPESKKETTEKELRKP